MSFNGWMDKWAMEYIRNGMLISSAKIWINLKWILLREWNQSEKAIYDMIPFMWQFVKRQNFRDNKQISSCHEFKVEEIWIVEVQGNV